MRRTRLEKPMKINIQKREPDKNGLRPIRLVYYYGSKTSEDGSRAQKRSYETLNLFLYNKPKNAVEREHNKTTLQKAEAIRAKRLLEMESAKHRLDDHTKLNASLFEGFAVNSQTTPSAAKRAWITFCQSGALTLPGDSAADPLRWHCWQRDCTHHYHGLLIGWRGSGIAR